MIEPQWERVARTKMGQHLTHVETEFILSHVDFSGKMVADIGSGGGKYTRLAKANGGKTVSLDYSKDSLLWLKHMDPSADVVVADIRAIPLRPSTFDCLIAMETLDYVSETDVVLGQCRKLLKNHGRMVVSFGNTSSIKSKLKRLLPAKYMQDQKTFNKVAAILRDCNFCITDKQGYNWIPFGRESNNWMLPATTKAADRLLGRLVAVSPWVVVCLEC